MAILDDSDEEQAEDEDMLLAWVLVGEEKEGRPKFYVSNRLAWEKHISGCITFVLMSVVFV